MTDPPEETSPSGHILAVDDNRVNRIKLARGLEQQGHRVSLAEDGEQALALLHTTGFDVVLLDIVMPGMDGYAVLEHIKRDPALRDIPVIVISALDELESAVKCIEMGAEDYLPKPFNPVLLKARLNACLQRKRLRDLEKAYLQQEIMLRQSEKLATLGRLSAGMAHELNNPAAAVQRGAEQLRDALERNLQAHLALNAAQLGTAEIASLNTLDETLFTKAARPGSLQLGSLERADREAALEDWLIDRGVGDAWELAPELVNMGCELDTLDGVVAQFDAGLIATVMQWLVSRFIIHSLLDEIGEGAGRVAEIVRALKTYSHLDQAPVQNVDVRVGLDNTLVMLRSKLKQGVTVQRDYAADLPLIEAYGSELNQVWTNIIDNAVAAMHGRGALTVRAYGDNAHVIVEIADDGPGIPTAIQSQIFDPFFTTKPPGEGTGLGLNISHNIVVQKHHGEISVQSQPGQTCFQIRLPLKIQAGIMAPPQPSGEG